MNFERTEQLLGDEALKKLSSSRIAVFGLGGVGGYVCEALARTGVGHLTLVDKDVIDPSNLNRQIIATTSTIGHPKTDVMKERLLSINPDMDVRCFCMFFLPENAASINLTEYDYVVDAVDTITAKLELIERCINKNVPIISSMGTGNKMDPSLLRIADLSKTRICPLARVMRRELKKRGIEHVRVIYSEEKPFRKDRQSQESAPTPREHKKDSPASAIFVPASAGLMIASDIVSGIISN